METDKEKFEQSKDAYKAEEDSEAARVDLVRFVQKYLYYLK